MKQEKEAEIIFQNLPNLKKEMDTMSKEYENPKQVNTKRLIPVHIILKKTNIKGRLFKSAREIKSHIKGTPILYQLFFHSNFAGHRSVV